MKKVLSLFLSVLMLTGVVAAVDLSAYAATSGSCGDNLTWDLDDEGVLTINGEGEMYDFDYPDEGPWYDYRDGIYYVVIQDGIKNIGNNAFSSCDKLTNVSIPNSVVEIGEMAFYGCDSLRSITIPEGVSSIGYRAFYQCWYLTRIILPSSLTKIEEESFCNCNISYVYYSGSEDDWFSIYIGSANSDLIYANIYYNYQADEHESADTEKSSNNGSESIAATGVIVIAVALVLLLMLATAIITFMIARRHYKKHN